MGRQKRKTVSPLQKDDGKSRRTGEEEAVSEAEEDSRSQNDWNRDVVADLKKFIQSENARNNKSLAEDIRKHSDERISALEESLSFALTANETLAKRLAEVEARLTKQTRIFTYASDGCLSLNRSWTRYDRRICRTGLSLVDLQSLLACRALIPMKTPHARYQPCFSSSWGST